MKGILKKKKFGRAACIAKKGKNKAYRSISLISTDAKILAKVLTHRLENILPAVIFEVQTGFVKGRHSFFNICHLLDMIYSAPKDTPDSVVFNDAGKDI